MNDAVQRVPGVHREVLREGEDLLLRTGVPAFLGYGAGAAPPVVLTRWPQFAARVAGVPADSLLAAAVRGFFAGLKKRQGIEVQVLERIRQVGPNKEGARGSYTIYKVAN